MAIAAIKDVSHPFVIVDEEVWKLEMPLKFEDRSSTPPHNYTRVADRRESKRLSTFFNQIWRHAELLTETAPEMKES